jgi:hypothetical protein
MKIEPQNVFPAGGDAPPPRPRLTAEPRRRLPAPPGHDAGTTIRAPSLADFAERYDVRRISPREMVELSLELYLAGFLAWEEYSLLAFQPELHPDYDRTVGALTGKPATPNRPRDFIALWEDRLSFESRYNRTDPATIDRTRHILAVLRLIDGPLRVVT